MQDDTLHHFGDHEDPWSIAGRIRARLGSGCYLRVSNFLDDDEARAKSYQKAFLEDGLGTGRASRYTRCTRWA